MMLLARAVLNDGRCCSFALACKFTSKEKIRQIEGSIELISGLESALPYTLTE